MERNQDVDFFVPLSQNLIRNIILSVMGGCPLRGHSSLKKVIKSFGGTKNCQSNFYAFFNIFFIDYFFSYFSAIAKFF
jgi:hypothetical protein